METTKEKQETARESLLKILKPGDTIYTITRHVSRSGMMRRISAFVVKNGELIDLDWQIAQTGLFKRHHTDEGLVIDGCGMDMHFHVVHMLGSALYPNGFMLPIAKDAPMGTPCYEPNGGYAFKKESL